MRAGSQPLFPVCRTQARLKKPQEWQYLPSSLRVFHTSTLQRSGQMRSTVLYEPIFLLAVITSLRWVDHNHLEEAGKITKFVWLPSDWQTSDIPRWDHTTEVWVWKCPGLGLSLLGSDSRRPLYHRRVWRYGPWAAPCVTRGNLLYWALLEKLSKHSILLWISWGQLSGKLRDWDKGEWTRRTLSLRESGEVSAAARWQRAITAGKGKQKTRFELPFREAALPAIPV